MSSVRGAIERGRSKQQTNSSLLPRMAPFPLGGQKCPGALRADCSDKRETKHLCSDQERETA